MNIQFNQRTGSRGIEWTDATYNITAGCLHRCRWRMPDGTVAICYAEEVAQGVAKAAYPDGFEHHYFREHQRGGMRRSKQPSLVFVDSMSDLFGHWVPEEHVRAVLDEVRQSPQHIGQVLTKNARRILEFLDLLPDNLWVGVSSPPDWMWGRQLSLVQQQKLLETELKTLAEIRVRRPDLVTWMSIEPLSWDISEFVSGNTPLQWAVIGAATNGKKAFQPAPKHVERLLQVLDSQCVPVFFKGNLRWNPWREDFPDIQHPALERRKQRAAEYGWSEKLDPVPST